ncbi:Rieske (2Fe-2S) protein [Ferroplasma sp.]|uniref:Rieske (2Fe-2S) protein n=1 Tax=Ferroplasma sp. TaxID=2591003 RepID=UPI00307E43A2
MTMDWKEIGNAAEIGNGKNKEFDINGKKVLVSNIDGKFYAIDAICSHMGGDLGHGKINGNDVICPRHHAQFDMKTGKVDKNINGFFKVMTRKDAKDLNSYQIKEEDGKLSINM